VIVGLARQGKALARHFAEQGAEVVVTDLRSQDELRPAVEAAELPLELALGGHPEQSWRAPTAVPGGVLPICRWHSRRAAGSVERLAALPEPVPPARSESPIRREDTVTALLGEMARLWAQSVGTQVWVGGNIGRPLLADLAQIGQSDLVVMELSSFQLELMTASPAIAVVLNLTPNHLDRHHTLEAYRRAKARILEFQSEGDIAVLGVEDPGAWALRKHVRGRLMGFARTLPDGVDGAQLEGESIVLRSSRAVRTICELAAIRLRGEHNLLNVLAACSAAATVDLPVAAMAEGIAEFRGVPHRLEFVRRVRGADWYNDSIATTPERSLAAIRSFEEPLVLLAGGRDKDLDWTEFGTVVRARLDHLVLFGEAAGKIAAAVGSLQPGDRLASIDRAPGLAEAVGMAAGRAGSGDVVLLAPGGTSFDEFVDFAERGDRFRQWVEAL
jgi:UDP-N-acetylmuramoylalanine--D-glutamate ligase